MDEVEEIKHKIDIVDLLSTYLTLKKAGVNYKAICPFHSEKTPSLMVSPEKQIFKCFGCGAGGDVFSFVMQMENLDFPEALKMLAERAGVKIPEYGKRKTENGQPDRKSKLFKINAFAAQVFHKILLEHPSGRPALEYLKKRQLTIETIKSFMIGYSPSSRAMLAYLKKHGFADLELQAAGNPDKFFKRIIFPIRDVMGNVVGFTGRVLDPDQQPKYLNTPETVIFHKSHLLYNLDKARGEIKTQKEAVVVEGQMDVIASWQAGVKNVVATSGTALTLEHLQALWRYSPNIIFAFDSDTAGLASAKKISEMAIIEGFNVKMANLGKYKDPGEMIAHDPKLWLKAVQGAGSVIDWYFELAFENRKSPLADKIENREMTSQQKKEIAKEILPLLKKIPDTIEQAHYVGLLSKRLAVSEKVIFDALEKVGVAGHQKPKRIEESTDKKTSPILVEDLLLAILLKYPAKIKTVQLQIRETDFQNASTASIYKQLLKCYDKSASEVAKALRQNAPRPLQLKIDELLMLAEHEESLLEELDEVMAKMQTNHKEVLKSYYAREIKKAENVKDLERLKKLIKEFQDAISK